MPRIETASTSKIQIDGRQIEENVAYVDLDQSISTHHVLKVRLRFVAQTSGSHDFIDTGTYTSYLGKSITLTITPHGNVVDASKQLEFIGTITRIDFDNSVEELNSVVIVAHSPTIALDGATRNSFFYDMKASEIISSVLGKHSISSGTVETTPDLLKFAVQYGETDYDFIMRLASANSLYVYYDGRNLNVKKADSGGPEELIWLQSLGSVSLALGTASYKIAGHSFDYVQKKELSGSMQARGGSYTSSAENASKQIYKNAGDSPLLHLALDQHALDSQLEATSKMSLGTIVTCTGESIIPSVKIGRCVKISGMDKFNGLYWVREVRHVVDESGKYHNTFEATPVETSFPPDRSSLQPFSHLQNALVTDNNDPDSLGRVKVKFPWSNNLTTPWLRIVFPDSGKERGWFYVPEINDEVLVGYEQGNPDLPVVLGCLYNGVDKPALTASDYVGSAGVKMKQFNTRNGNKVLFKDEDGKEQIKITQKDGKNSILLSMDPLSIAIESEGDIKIKGKNISLEAEKDFKVKANAVSLTSDAKTEIKASADLALNGTNVKSEASAMHDVKAGGVLTIKGSMVQIN